MPQQSQIHIDQALTNLSLNYRNEEYVADQIIPMVAVDKRTDKYFVYGKEHLRYRESKVRPGAVADEFEYSVSQNSYNAERRARRHFIADDEIRMQDVPLSAESDAAEALTDTLRLVYETDVANYVTNNSNMTNYTALAGTNQWSDYANSSPLVNLKTAKASVRLNALKPANTFMVPYETALNLADHPSIKDLVKYTDPNSLTESGLPAIVRGLRVVEPTAASDSAVEGRAFTAATVWGKNALICYVNPSAGRRTISTGYAFRAPDAITGAQGFATRQYRDDERGGVWVEVAITYDIRVVSVGAAYLFQTVI